MIKLIIVSIFLAVFPMNFEPSSSSTHGILHETTDSVDLNRNSEELVDTPFESFQIQFNKTYTTKTTGIAMIRYDPNQPLDGFLLTDSDGWQILNTFSITGSLDGVNSLLVNKVINRELNIALQRANIRLGIEQLDKFE